MAGKRIWLLATAMSLMAVTAQAAVTHHAAKHKPVVAKVSASGGKSRSVSRGRPAVKPVGRAKRVAADDAVVATTSGLSVVPLPALAPLPADPQDAYNARSMSELQALAQKNDTRAQYTLGLNYRSGRGTEASPADAFKWQSQAAQAGFAPAQADLGFMYLNGVGVPQDNGRAMALEQQSAAQGDKNGQYLLGIMYDKGLNAAADPAAAMALFRKSADQGFAPAQWKLGSMYFAGTGTAKDPAAAKSWFEKAAAGGDPEAEYALGQMAIESGDTPGAINWFQRATAHGNADGAYNLGVIYHDGRGVTPDFRQSYKWMIIAQAMGASGAGNVVNVLVHHMTKADIASAKASAVAQVKAWGLAG